MPLSTELEIALGSGGMGVQRFEADRNVFVIAPVEIGLLDAMAAEANRKPVWSDLLVERLRMGRGRAISSQRRGRGLEDFVEGIIQKAFGNQYDMRCQFVGARKIVAKCDFAIPSGNSREDIIGDLDTIIRGKAAGHHL